jgi:hypothetical protein
MLHDQAFGTSEAAINLARMLNELNDPKASAKVAHFFAHHYYMVNTINRDVKDPRVKRYIFTLMRRAIKVKLDLPQKVRTHMENVFVGRIREILGA